MDAVSPLRGVPRFAPGRTSRREGGSVLRCAGRAACGGRQGRAEPQAAQPGSAGTNGRAGVRGAHWPAPCARLRAAEQLGKPAVVSGGRAAGRTAARTCCSAVQAQELLAALNVRLDLNAAVLDAGAQQTSEQQCVKTAARRPTSLRLRTTTSMHPPAQCHERCRAIYTTGCGSHLRTDAAYQLRGADRRP